MHKDTWPQWEHSPVLCFSALVGAVDDFIPAHGPKPPKTRLHNILTVPEYSTLFKLLAVTAYILIFTFN